MAFPKYNEDGKVICQLCGAAYQRITPTHLEKHNTTVDEYRIQFPEYPFNKIYTEEDKEAYQEKFGDNVPNVVELVEDLEELEIEKEESLYPNPKKLIPDDKLDLLNFLKLVYPSVVDNFLIEQNNLSGTLAYSFITDIADPVTKTIFEFPKAFWHNRDVRPSVQKFKILREDGWKTFTILEPRPTPKILQEYIDVIIDL